MASKSKPVVVDPSVPTEDNVVNGRIVHYVEEDGYHSAAIITHVWGIFNVNLWVMRDGPVHAYRRVTSVTHEFPEGKLPNSWHFIEK